MILSGSTFLKLLVVIAISIIISCSNFTTINFKPEHSPVSNDINRYLYYFEETLADNFVEVTAKHIDTSGNYIYDIKYFHPPGEPISVNKDITTHFELKGRVVVSKGANSQIAINLVSLKWNQEGPTEAEIIEAFNREIINEFKEKIEKL
jgi:hypothetical protein